MNYKTCLDKISALNLLNKCEQFAVSDEMMACFEFMGDYFTAKSSGKEMWRKSASFLEAAYRLTVQNRGISYAKDKQNILRKKLTLVLDGWSRDTLGTAAKPCMFEAIDGMRGKGLEKLEVDRAASRAKINAIWNCYSDNDEEAMLISSEKIRYICVNASNTYKALIIHQLNICRIVLEKHGFATEMKHAFVCFGSVARNEATLYSDFEFGILVPETVSDEDRLYWRHLSQLLEFSIMALGETPIPSSWVGNTFTDKSGWHPSGICYDLGGKTALGRQFENASYDYELICTPSQMADLLSRESEERYKELDPSLCVVIDHASLLCGDKDLFAEYESRKAIMLSREVLDASGEKRPLREIRALRLLQSDIKKFNPVLDINFKEAVNFHVKKDFYRLLNVALAGLALFYGWKVGSSWDVIDRLQSTNHHLSTASTNIIRVALGISNGIRLRTYAYYQQQNDLITIGRKNVQSVSGIMNCEGEGVILRLYQNIVSMREMIQAFCDDSGMKSLSFSS